MSKVKGGGKVVKSAVMSTQKVNRKARADKAAAKKASRKVTPRGTDRVKARKQADVHNLHIQKVNMAVAMQTAQAA